MLKRMVTQRARVLPSLAKARRKVNFYRFLRPLNERDSFDMVGELDSLGEVAMEERIDDESTTQDAERKSDELTNLMRPDLFVTPSPQDPDNPWSNVTMLNLGHLNTTTLLEWQRLELGKCCLGHNFLLPDAEVSLFAEGVTVNSHPRTSLIGALQDWKVLRSTPLVTNAHFVTEARTLPRELRESLRTGGFICGQGKSEVVVGSILRFVRLSFPGIAEFRAAARVAVYPAVGNGTDPFTHVTGVVRRDTWRECWLPAYMLGCVAGLGPGAPGLAGEQGAVWSAFDIPSYSYGLDI
jgi:hypothetical protein